MLCDNELEAGQKVQVMHHIATHVEELLLPNSAKM